MQVVFADLLKKLRRLTYIIVQTGTCIPRTHDALSPWYDEETNREGADPVSYIDPRATWRSSKQCVASGDEDVARFRELIGVGEKFPSTQTSLAYPTESELAIEAEKVRVDEHN